jgi:hypothetical protein
VKPLIVLSLFFSLAHAQAVRIPAALDPVASDFCKTCRRVTNAALAGVGTATVYEEQHPASEGRSSTYWLVVANSGQAVAGAVFDLFPRGSCSAGHCYFADRVVPSVRFFSYLAKTRVADVGLELDIDRTDEVNDVPRTRTHWKQWVFIACGKNDTDAWVCRSTESRCEHAGWARSAEPAVQSTCTEPLGRDSDSTP